MSQNQMVTKSNNTCSTVLSTVPITVPGTVHCARHRPHHRPRGGGGGGGAAEGEYIFYVRRVAEGECFFKVLWGEFCLGLEYP